MKNHSFRLITIIEVYVLQSCIRRKIFYICTSRSGRRIFVALDFSGYKPNEYFYIIAVS
jgi:hypothetical protein